MRKQFDLNYYMEHPETKVVTRSGLSARIICTDAKSEGKESYPVVVLVSFCNSETVFKFTSDGLIFEGMEHDNDLFFDLPDPEKKRVPLTYEDLLQRVKEGKTMWIINDRDTVFNIVDFDFEFVYIINGDAREVEPYSYEYVMDGITFTDGTPCWKEVDCE